jgi:hypothetical protein
MPHRLCPVCRKPGRMLPASGPDAVATYYRCDTCGRVWTHRNDAPDSPPTPISVPSKG